MWIQSGSNKPQWANIKDQAKADIIIAKGSFNLDGNHYEVISTDPEFSKVIKIFYDNWEHYKVLKDKVEHFKKYKVWL